MLAAVHTNAAAIPVASMIFFIALTPFGLLTRKVYQKAFFLGSTACKEYVKGLRHKDRLEFPGNSQP
jgi:hypothetical protein